MKEVKLNYTKNGYSYIKCTKEDCFRWGGYAVCDSCGKDMEDCYLIFILAQAFCKNCFKDWLKNNKRYEEDLMIQNQNHIKWYEYHGFKIGGINDKEQRAIN